MGDGETGGNVAAPIFRDFMAEALKDAPAVPFPDPPGADMVLVNSITGQPTGSYDKDAVLEAFRPGTGPGSGYGNPSTMPSASDPNAPVVSANDGLPLGTIVPPPPPFAMPPGMAPRPSSGIVLTGTGGLY